MKVLLWTQYFWPEHFHINEVAISLREAGEDVTVLTGKPNYPDGEIYSGYRAMGIADEKHQGVDLVRVPLRARGAGGAKGLALNYLSFVLSGYFVAPFALRRRKCDVVFVYAPSPILQALPAVFVAWIKRAPLVLWVQDLWPEALIATGFGDSRLLLRSMERVVRYIYRRSDLILIQSEAFRAPVERLVNDITKVHFHPNSVKELLPERIPSAETRELAEDIARHFSVVYAGNIGSVQAIDTVVDAARRLQGVDGVRFYLIGGGSATASIAAEIERAGIDNVIMPGQVRPEEIPAIYAAASVLLVSMKDDKLIGMTIPNKLQVYMAAGKPIIVSGSGEPARVLTQAQAGLVCRPEHADALARTVVTLREMPAETRAKFGENGRSWFIQHYRLPERTAALIEHFNQAIVRHGSRRSLIRRLGCLFQARTEDNAR